MDPIRGTSLHGLSLAPDAPWTLEYTFAGSVDLADGRGQREPGEPARTVVLGALAERPRTGAEALADGRWRWDAKVHASTRYWAKAVLAAELDLRHLWYRHEDELVLVWASVPSRVHEQELLDAGFHPAGATWRAPATEQAERLVRRLVRAPVRWHRPALGRLSAPEGTAVLPDEDALVARADQAWTRWWSLFRTEVHGYPLHGRPVLDLERGSLELRFLRGEALWSVQLDLRHHPLRYPARLQRGDRTIDVAELAWEDFYFLPQFAADLAARGPATMTTVLPPPRPRDADVISPELSSDRLAFLDELAQQTPPDDLHDLDRIERNFRHERADAADHPIRFAEAGLITEALLLAARDLEVRLYLHPWGLLLVLDDGRVVASRQLGEKAAALAPGLPDALRQDVRALLVDAAIQASEFSQAFGLTAPERAHEILFGPVVRRSVGAVDRRWPTEVIEAFERTPGPRLVLDRVLGTGERGRFFLVREGGDSETAEDRLATIVLTHQGLEEVDWSERARNEASRAAIEARLVAALAVARGERPDAQLPTALVDDLTRRVEALGEARDPATELEALLADLREPTALEALERWLTTRGWTGAAEEIRAWDGEWPSEFLAELWDALREAYLQTTTIERHGDGWRIPRTSLLGGARVLMLGSDPPRLVEVPVRVGACDEAFCEVQVSDGALTPSSKLYDLSAHTPDELAAFHAHWDAAREGVTRAPRALDQLRRALRLTARLIESPRCQGAARAAAIDALRRAWRVHDAARTLLVQGRPESSLLLAQEAAELAVRASAEAGVECAAGVQVLPLGDIAPAPPPRPRLASPPALPAASRASMPDEAPSMVHAEHPSSPPIRERPPSQKPASPLAHGIEVLERHAAAFGLRVDPAEARGEPPQLAEVRRALDLSGALLEAGRAGPEVDRSVHAPMWVTPPAPTARGRLRVDLPALRRAIADEKDIVVRSDVLKGTGTVKVNVNRMWSHFTTSVYQSGDLPVLATRETLQNSLDAIRAAIKAGRLREREGRFSVTWDPARRVLTWEDNGIGMDVATIEHKFLSLGDTGKTDEATDAIGGFGVAKAVILGTSETFRWEVHTRNNRVVSEGIASHYQIFEADFFAGTRITVFDVHPKFDRRMMHGRGEVSLLDRLGEFLAANDLPHLAMTLDGKEVRPMFSRRGGSEVPTEGSWGDGTTARVKAYRRPPGDKQGAYYVRLAGLFQFMRSSYDGLKVDIVVDLSTSLRPGDPAYPLNAARDALQARAHAAFWDLIGEVEREDESTGHSSEYETFDPESDEPGERSGAAELAELAAGALADPEFQTALAAAADGIVDFYREQAKDPGVDLPTESLAPAGSKARQDDGPTRHVELPPGLLPTAIAPPVASDVASPTGGLAGAARELRTVLEVAEEVGRAEGVSGGVLPAEVKDVLVRAEQGTALGEWDVRTLEDAIDRATEAAIGPGGGGLLQAAAINRTADMALSRLAAGKRRERRNPFGRMAGLKISRKQYDRRRAAQFRKSFQRWLPHLTLWDATLRLLATEARIRRKFKAGFVLDDKVYGLASNGVVYLQPDKFALVVKAHRERPMGIAAFLHGIACHELTHLDGRMHEGHSESFMAAREDLGFATGHLIPVIALLAQRLLGLKAKPSPERRRIAALERQLQRTRTGGGERTAPEAAEVARLRRALVEARAALSQAEADSARIRHECDEQLAAHERDVTALPEGQLHVRAARALAEGWSYYEAVRARVLVGASTPGPLLPVLEGVVSAVARVTLRALLGDTPDLDLAPFESAVLDRELGRENRSLP